MIDQELLDELWNFGYAGGSAARFAAAAQDPAFSVDEQAEFLTQQARALGLQERFDEAWGLLERVASLGNVAVRTRVALERGRLLNSAGAASDAVAGFEDAAGLARDTGLEFLELDALHMLAIADRGRSEEWAERGIRLALTAVNPRTQRWLVSLHNNLGWSRLDAGHPESALDAFREAAGWAERVGTPEQRVWAREAVDECQAAIARQG
jgi:tetratricopeptide (TPR) repeat protein